MVKIFGEDSPSEIRQSPGYGEKFRVRKLERLFYYILHQRVVSQIYVTAHIIHLYSDGTGEIFNPNLRSQTAVPSQLFLWM